MTIFHTSQFKRALWITSLSFILAFAILISAPTKVFGALGDGDAYTGGCRYTYWGYQWTDNTNGTLWVSNPTGTYFYPNQWSWALWKYDGGWALWGGNGGGNGCNWSNNIDLSTFPNGSYNFTNLWNQYQPFDVVNGSVIWEEIPGQIPGSSLTITSPASGSSASSTFPLNFTYNLQGENSDKMYIVFEAWSASSTCPIYGTPEWQTEYSAGWFYNQSLPYFSPILTATSTSATSSIQVYNLEQPYTYNCNYCYFYNYEEETSTLVNKCPDYILNVSGYVSPSQPLPIGSWQNYYASHTSSHFGTSTAIFDTIAGTFNDIVSKLTSFVNDFRSIFDAESANAQGTNLGQKIPLVRGYLKPINDFFGGVPVSEMFMLVLLVLLVVVIYRIVARILHLIRG